MKHNSHQFHYGLKDGAPIGLGYLAASFTFGITARGVGPTTPQSVVIPFTNLTNTGQFAALGIIQTGVPFMGMAMAQLIINLHHCLMPRSLSQKLSAGVPFLHYSFTSYGATDEIFGVSVCHPGCLSPFYSYGLICAAVPDWTLGTLLRAVSGELLPARLLSVLGVALYGMFLVVVVPPAKTSRILTDVTLASMVLSLVFAHMSFLAGLSSDFKIILLTILIVGTAAILFPIKEDDEYES